MALAWTITDQNAKSIYTRLCNWYNSPENLPNTINGTGVFFGYPNFTRDKLIYCVQFLKENFGAGWFTSDYSARSDVLRNLSKKLYNVFSGQVDENGIYKFLTWVYTFAKDDTTALNYFQNGYYSYIGGMADTAKEKVVKPASEAAEAVEYGIKYPVLTLNNPVLKWGGIAAVAALLLVSLKR